jgi:hypothetical protein
MKTEDFYSPDDNFQFMDPVEPIEFETLKAERTVKVPMKKNDPGEVDFSDEFFLQLHDKIMAGVEKTTIRPRAPEKPKNFSRIVAQKLMTKHLS